MAKIRDDQLIVGSAVNSGSIGRQASVVPFFYFTLTNIGFDMSKASTSETYTTVVHTQNCETRNLL